MTILFIYSFLDRFFGNRILRKQSGHYYVINHILTLGLSEVQKSALHSIAVGLLHCQSPGFWYILQWNPHSPFSFNQGKTYAIVACPKETSSETGNSIRSSAPFCARVHTPQQEVCFPFWCGCPVFSPKPVPQHSPALHHMSKVVLQHCQQQGRISPHIETPYLPQWLMKQRLIFLRVKWLRVVRGNKNNIFHIYDSFSKPLSN